MTLLLRYVSIAAVYFFTNDVTSNTCEKNVSMIVLDMLISAYVT